MRPVLPLFLLLSFLAAGCASSYVLVGKVRPPIAPEQVKVYLRPPAKYEEIALLDASSKNSWAVTQQAKMNKAMERLKAEAAGLGANGILLGGSGTEYGARVVAGVGAVPVVHRSATGVAIYVSEE